MSTLNNYMFQSFNFRAKKKLKPFYDLVASITAEEFGHVELVSAAINLLSTGITRPGDPDTTPLRNGLDARNTYYFIATAQTALPADSMGNPWNGTYVFNSGNLIEDFLHNFFLEIGARTHKMRVYEMTDAPVAREMIGYLLVRGGMHIVAYAKALEILTGVDVTRMLPIPSLTTPNLIMPENTSNKDWITFFTLGVNMTTATSTESGEGNPETGAPLSVVRSDARRSPMPDLEKKPEELPGIDKRSL